MARPKPATLGALVVGALLAAIVSVVVSRLDESVGSGLEQRVQVEQIQRELERLEEDLMDLRGDLRRHEDRDYHEEASRYIERIDRLVVDVERLRRRMDALEGRPPRDPGRM